MLCFRIRKIEKLRISSNSPNLKIGRMLSLMQHRNAYQSYWKTGVTRLTDLNRITFILYVQIVKSLKI